MIDRKPGLGESATACPKLAVQVARRHFPPDGIRNGNLPAGAGPKL
jgi:hypothetical protein